MADVLHVAGRVGRGRGAEGGAAKGQHVSALRGIMRFLWCFFFFRSRLQVFSHRNNKSSTDDDTRLKLGGGGGGGGRGRGRPGRDQEGADINSAAVHAGYRHLNCFFLPLFN